MHCGDSTRHIKLWMVSKSYRFSLSLFHPMGFLMSLSGSGSEISAWYMMDEVGTAVRHSDTPNFKYVARCLTLSPSFAFPPPFVCVLLEFSTQATSLSRCMPFLFVASGLSY